MNPVEFLKNKTKDVAAAGFNQLPDRGNLFLRYMTGLGNRNLDLDDSTLTSLRDATVKPPEEAIEQHVHGPTGQEWSVLKPGPWRFEPKSGAVDPYGRGYGTDVTHTLGRFTAGVNPDKTAITMTDTYDMENEFEDPDLVSGKFQPVKAAETFLLAFPQRLEGGDIKPFDASNLGRAAMYLSPFKPKSFPVDITVPYSGDIDNKETYNN